MLEKNKGSASTRTKRDAKLAMGCLRAFCMPANAYQQPLALRLISDERQK